MHTYSTMYINCYIINNRRFKSKHLQTNNSSLMRLNITRLNKILIQNPMYTKQTKIIFCGKKVKRYQRTIFSLRREEKEQSTNNISICLCNGIHTIQNPNPVQAENNSILLPIKNHNSKSKTPRSYTDRRKNAPSTLTTCNF